MTKLNLAQYANVLIVRVAVNGLPGSSKLDRGQTDKLVKDNNTSKRHARVTKTLFADSPRATRLRQIASEVRAYLQMNALPGDANGKYLIAAAKYVDIGKILKAFEAEYNTVRDAFVADLDAEIAKDRLGKNSIFEIGDYPTETEVQVATGFRWVFEPMADAESFTKMFDEEAIVKDLQDKFDASKTDLLSKAAEINLGRLEACIRSQLDRIAEYERKTKAGKDCRLSYNSVYDGLKMQSQMSQDLNINGDPKVVRICGEIATALSELGDSEELKDVIKRQDLVNALRSMLGQPAPQQPPVPSQGDLVGIPTIDEEPEELSPEELLKVQDEVADRIIDEILAEESETIEVSVGSVDLSGLDF